jgi:hypothetical protein
LYATVIEQRGGSCHERICRFLGKARKGHVNVTAHIARWLRAPRNIRKFHLPVPPLVLPDLLARLLSLLGGFALLMVPIKDYATATKGEPSCSTSLQLP